VRPCEEKPKAHEERFDSPVHIVFQNVLKKFFTVRGKYENNQATRNRRAAMIARIKTLTARAEPSLAGDIAGLAALFLMLFAALALPGAA
jgi:hypothetical protein